MHLDTGMQKHCGCPHIEQALEDIQKSNEEDEESSDEENDSKDECNNPFSNVTCLCPEDPSANVLVNTGSDTIKKKTSKKSS